MSNYLRRFATLCLLAQACIHGAAAGQTIVSGGASLPLPLYQETLAKLPPGIFPSYVGTGSTAGLRAFLLNTADTFGRNGAVHWIGSETPLTQAQIADYLVQGWGRQGDPAGHGPLIQIPAAYVAVTISYKGPSQPVTLSSRQLCAIFSGMVDRWSQLGVSVPPSLDAFKLVYRADGSGTTALLTRHLRAVCETGGALRFTGKSVSGGVPARALAGPFRRGAWRRRRRRGDGGECLGHHLYRTGPRLHRRDQTGLAGQPA
ncbi:substrate-binding domain-containing protein [Achromobacter xylosoxidans]